MKKNSADSRKARAMLIFSRVLVYALLVFLSVLCLFSFYMLIVNASRTNADLQGGFKALPQGHFLENLVNAWDDGSINIPRGLLNSFIVAAATAVLSTYFSALTAYGLHAYNFRLKHAAFLFIMAVMVIPKQVSATGFVQLCYKAEADQQLSSADPSGNCGAGGIFLHDPVHEKRAADGDRGGCPCGRFGGVFHL